MAEGNRGSLELYSHGSDSKCDGCGERIAADKKVLIGIESCCGGGCTRELCEECVTWAYQQFQKEKV